MSDKPTNQATFAKTFTRLRIKAGLNCGEFTTLVGVERYVVSALTYGMISAREAFPDPGQLGRVCDLMLLDDVERAALFQLRDNEG